MEKTMKTNIKTMKKDELQSMLEMLLTQNIELQKQLESSDKRVNDSDIVIKKEAKTIFVYLSGKSMKSLVAFAKQLKDSKQNWLLSYDSDKKAWKCSNTKENASELEDFKEQMLVEQPR